MFQYEGKRVVGPNGERGTIRNGQLVLDEPQALPLFGPEKRLALGEHGYSPASARWQQQPAPRLGSPLGAANLPIEADLQGSNGLGSRGAPLSGHTMPPTRTLLSQWAEPFADPRAQLLGVAADEPLPLGRLPGVRSVGMQAQPLVANVQNGGTYGLNGPSGFPGTGMASRLGAAPAHGEAAGMMHLVGARAAGQGRPARPGMQVRPQPMPSRPRGASPPSQPKRARKVVAQAEESGLGFGYIPATAIPKVVKDDREFQAGMTRLAKKYGVAEDDLYRVMAFETGQSFSPSQRNRKGSSAIGLIQFMTHKGSWAAAKGYSREKLSKMSRTEQLRVVDEYFYSNGLHKIDYPNIDDLYLTIYKPKARGKPGYVHAKKGSVEYDQNSDLDSNGDGVIRGLEISHKVRNDSIPGVGVYKAPLVPNQTMSPNSLRYARTEEEMWRALMNNKRDISVWWRHGRRSPSNGGRR